jgi:hypothetical protein
MYWGQDDGPGGDGSEGSIPALLKEKAVNQILVTFALPCEKSKIFTTAAGVKYIDIFFAGHASTQCALSNSDTYPGVTAQNCKQACCSYVPDCTATSSPLAADLKQAQQQGAKVLLSIGGGAESAGKLTSMDGSELLDVIASMYLTPDPAYKGPRPFGDFVFDGIDLDFEQEWGSAAPAFITKFIGEWSTRKYAGKFLLSMAPQCFDFNDQYGSVIKPLIAASTKDGTLLSPELIGMVDQLHVQFYNNEGAMDDGSKFSTSGDEKQLAMLLNDSKAECWEDYTYSYYRGGKKHCLSSKFLSTAMIWNNIAAGASAWRKTQGLPRTTVLFGTPLDAFDPDAPSTGGFPWKEVYVHEKDSSLALRQITEVLSKIFSDLTHFNGVFMWDRGNDNYMGKKLPGGTKPSQIVRQAVDASSRA